MDEQEKEYPGYNIQKVWKTDKSKVIEVPKDP